MFSTMGVETNTSDRLLPYIIQGRGMACPQAIEAYFSQEKVDILAKLQVHGAVLLRDFKIDTASQFRSLIETLGIHVSDDYPLGISPRSQFEQGVFNSTEVPGPFPLFAHNEMAYLSDRPAFISFYCAVAPEQWGETPLFDTQQAFNRLSDNTKALLLKKRFKYSHYYKKQLSPWQLGVELTWPRIFQTEDKMMVSRSLESRGYPYYWGRGERLKYETITPAVLEHPHSGSYCLNLQLPHWYTLYRIFKMLNGRQSRVLNYSLMLASLLRYVSKQMTTYLTFEDNSRIGYALAKEIYNALWQSSVIFSWQKQDLLLVDNRSVAHGRMNVVPPRKIMVIMGNMYSIQK